MPRRKLLLTPPARNFEFSAMRRADSSNLHSPESCPARAAASPCLRAIAPLRSVVGRSLRPRFPRRERAFHVAKPPRGRAMLGPGGPGHGEDDERGRGGFARRLRGAP